MFAWFFALDPTAQVAMLGLLAALVTGGFGLIRAFLKPKDEKTRQAYAPKVTFIQLTDRDLNVFEDISTNLDKLSDTVERLRVQISLKK